MTVRPAKTQISLGIRPFWSASSLCAQCVAKDPSFLHADSEDSDLTGRMLRLIWVFAGRIDILLVLSWGGSFLIIFCIFALGLETNGPLPNSEFNYFLSREKLQKLHFVLWPTISVFFLLQFQYSIQCSWCHIATVTCTLVNCMHAT